MQIILCHLQVSWSLSQSIFQSSAGNMNYKKKVLIYAYMWLYIFRYVVEIFANYVCETYWSPGVKTLYYPCKGGGITCYDRLIVARSIKNNKKPLKWKYY